MSGVDERILVCISVGCSGIKSYSESYNLSYARIYSPNDVDLSVVMQYMCVTAIAKIYLSYVLILPHEDLYANYKVAHRSTPRYNLQIPNPSTLYLFPLILIPHSNNTLTSKLNIARLLGPQPYDNYVHHRHFNHSIPT